ncbi:MULTISPECIES: exodeoxyribonuclease VII large subunit [Pectobacterium]|uniref:Exodeoxyribonuclease 7 large subunit n=1 Tax=Pectobacterium carotovorum subsp. carotovorum (strain PC1) TaxID=561230 RepID=EX7L_PECCP|nr:MULTISPECIES: exodeoxyribonuclease VII large subunit [Pectobacterium]C6DBG5.1 RecName: Full=Exodeoxyribonuclease 7 large subunit; AltName: Full=Exodeoxyribonuclease VII large subunit; Short=Exonuclease VII large subunit [Pectobacterium carotovorum subsp. carotovorum PC1]ACT14028.1 exodeoxyribonuclease VII, large subunit [Pectobacterium carotovorum subsp. carotovorum PC1]MBG0753654.1 Exodeoxyribonuclease 7 large subunit [Pectobacterium carotovorum subsp. carotovorum PCCS1]
MSQFPSSAIFTVSRLNQTVRQLLEMEMGQIWLSGEISNLSQPSSGHWYFTLKDERAQVRCAMFRTSNRRVTFRPQNGQQVLIRATITLYEPRGDYQLLAESMQPAGDGLLQQQFEQLKQKLAAEGLFDQQFKQVLPSPAKQVGVITSASGAALHDILQVLQRRDPSLPVIVYPTSVQGADAPLQIVRAIELANQREECDVLIVGRGGGSLEDLWSFNDERVARAIFASRIPIVSAVGHETDVTIADFVGDLRAPTPSAAAELVSRNQLELLRQIQSQRQRLEMAMDYYLAQRNREFTRLHHRLQQQHPQLRLARQQAQLVKLRQRLDDAMQQQLRQTLRRSERLQQRLMQQQPQTRIHRAQQRLQQLSYQMQSAVERQLNQNKQKLGIACSRLEGVSPLATLARGYNVTTAPDGKVLKNVTQITPGETLKTRLQDGWVESQVTTLVPNPSSVKKRRKPSSQS